MRNRQNQSMLDAGAVPELGAVWDGQGVRFAVYSENADLIEVSLFDNSSEYECARIALTRRENIWSIYLPDIEPGQRYGFRAHGRYTPAKGLYFNPNKLLLDPYAYCLDRNLRWFEGCHPYKPDKGVRHMDERDNAIAAPKAVVINHAFDWEGDRLPGIPFKDSIIYELHVKGFTQLHPRIPAEDRGTFRGLSNPAVIHYLQELGITAVELLPCMASITNKRLLDLGLSNYWGYDPIAWFAPDSRFAVQNPVVEFKQMVKALHAAGIEVILDVVFNHTGEEDEKGPCLNFRGFDNPVYYRVDPKAPHRYIDNSGCGNAVHAEHPYMTGMILDCLRYWVTQMHVDGFRFDLASCMAREHGVFNPQAKLLTAIVQDPVLSQIKLIAEPWDLGLGGYQLGNFPGTWAEWNDRYRDNVRRYWRGDEHQMAELASRITGSPDIFRKKSASCPLQASINYVTAHDGFTLRDLVSYVGKHNAANGEHNRDGHNANFSANYGIEGPATDPVVYALRLRQQKNMLTTLLLSAGVPMLLAGDERGHTQNGNNNAYCQDNELAWIDWEETELSRSLSGFIQRLIRFRKQHGIFQGEDFFTGELLPQYGYRDIEWFRPDALPMSRADWNMPYARCITILMLCEQSSLLWIVNAGNDAVRCRLPAAPEGGAWQRILDTANDTGDDSGKELFYKMEAHATAVFVETIQKAAGAE